MTPGVVAEAIEKARIELLHQGPWESIRESERTARLRVLLGAMENAGVLDGLATLRERSARLGTVTDDLAAARKKLADVEAAHAAELADAQAAHAAELTDAQAAHAAELADAAEDHRRQTDEHTAALDALRAQLTETEDRRRQAEERATDLDAQLTGARQDLADAQAAHAAELADAAEDHLRQTDEHTAALDALRAQLTETEDRRRQTDERAADLDAQLTGARQDLADAQTAHAAELTAAAEDHRRQTDEHTAALDALRAQLTETEDRRRQTEERATDLDAQLTGARQDLADAQTAHAAELADAADVPAGEGSEPRAAKTPDAGEPEVPQPPVESFSLLRRILTGALRSAPDIEGRHRE